MMRSMYLILKETLYLLVYLIIRCLVKLKFRTSKVIKRSMLLMKGCMNNGLYVLKETIVIEDANVLI